MVPNMTIEDLIYCEIFGIPALYLDYRLLRDAKVPEELKDFNVMRLRHCDDDWTCPVELKEYIMVNHMGTVFTKHRFDNVIKEQGVPVKYDEYSDDPKSDWLIDYDICGLDAIKEYYENLKNCTVPLDVDVTEEYCLNYNPVN
jgi:hypothetical protein